MIRPELVQYLNTLGMDRIDGKFKEPFAIEINGIRYSAAANMYSALLLRIATVDRELEERYQTSIRSWVFDSIDCPKKLVDLEDLRQWCAPQASPEGWSDEETNESGVDFPVNRGSLFGVRINRQLLWQLIAPLPGDNAVVSVSVPDKHGTSTPFVIEGDGWIAVLMPHHQERTLIEAPDYPEYAPLSEAAQ